MSDSNSELKKTLARQMASRQISDEDVDAMAARVVEIGGESRRIESLPEGIILDAEARPADIEALVKKALLDRGLDRIEILVNGIVNPESYRIRATLRRQ